MKNSWQPLAPRKGKRQSKAVSHTNDWSRRRRRRRLFAQNDGGVLYYAVLLQRRSGMSEIPSCNGLWTARVSLLFDLSCASQENWKYKYYWQPLRRLRGAKIIDKYTHTSKLAS
jgi:hypothetical protein